MRFFIEPSQIDGNQIKITGEDAKHLSVLRHKPGDTLIACSGNGYEYICEISSLTKDMAIVDVLSEEVSKNEPGFKITLFQALPKSDKMELIIQKAVELGVYAIVPVETDRCIVRLNDASRKTSRWQKISESAAKQSERGIIPQICEPVDFNAAVAALSGLDEAYMAYEKETTSIKQIFTSSKGKTVGIFIGPEGGFTDEETLLCKQSGIKTVSLGKRILRTETAGFTALICIMLLREEI